MKATYVTIWDDGIEIKSSCNYAPDTKKVTNVQTVEVNNVDILIKEYIELQDKTIIPRKNYRLEGEDFD